jgi:ABC-2 type transport system permease protein
MQSNRKQPSLTVQLVDVFLMQLSNWRWSWRSMIVTGMITPIFSIVGMGVLSHNAGTESLSYVLTGNIVLALMFEILEKVSSNFSYMKTMGTLQFFATLPLRRYVLIVATVLAFLLLSLPAIAVTMIFGSLFLHIPIHFNPLVLLILPLIALSLAGIGALLGTSTRTPEEANSLTLLFTLIMLGLGPVIFPPSRLPQIMIWLGRISPATYASSALYQTLIGPPTGILLIDIAVLLAFTIVTLWLVGLKLDWRTN